MKRLTETTMALLLLISTPTWAQFDHLNYELLDSLGVKIEQQGRSHSFQKAHSSVPFDPSLKPFYHGVASGDPLEDRVIIWTRADPGDANGAFDVSWEMATDTMFADIVQSGTFTTDAQRDYTVKVDVTGLGAGQWYYYRFYTSEDTSITGRTRTAPDGPVGQARFAVVSGSNYNEGYFNAYRTIGQRNDLDAVIHLGDYIYEYGSHHYGDHEDRALHPETEIMTLDDYRLRYSHYRLDPDLMLAHQQYPWIIVWDDHETANNSWKNGAENHDESEGDWESRKAHGIQAFFEWIPIRENPEQPNSIYRTIPFGDLLDLIFLDTRLEERDQQVSTSSGQIDDTTRTMLGKKQYEWLTRQMDSSNAQWKIISQQVMMAPLMIGTSILNSDQWDGYRAERQKILNYIMDNNIEDVFVITGDIHTSWANDIPLDSTYNAETGANSVCPEFVTPSITSESLPIGSIDQLIMKTNPHIKYVDLMNKGYFVLNVDSNKAQADWYFVDDIMVVTDKESFDQGWYVNSGERYIQEAAAPSQKTDELVAMAPLSPNYHTTDIEENTKYDQLVLLGLFPNPVDEELQVNYTLANHRHVNIKLFSLEGKLAATLLTADQTPGIYHLRYNCSTLPPGMYLIQLDDGAKKITRRIVVN